MKDCKYKDVCEIRANDDLCKEYPVLCLRKRQYDAIEARQLEIRSEESWVVRMLEGDIGLSRIKN